MPRRMYRVLLPALVASTLASCARHNVEAASDGTIVEPYLGIHKALAADKLDDIGAMASSLEEFAASRTGEGGVERIVEGARGLSDDDELADARVSFRILSAGIIEHLRSHPDLQTGLMIAFCPMTFEGTGAAWVQRLGPIENPYEGSRMLHCGEKRPWVESEG